MKKEISEYLLKNTNTEYNDVTWIATALMRVKSSIGNLSENENFDGEVESRARVLSSQISLAKGRSARTV